MDGKIFENFDKKLCKLKMTTLDHIKQKHHMNENQIILDNFYHE